MSDKKILEEFKVGDEVYLKNSKFKMLINKIDADEITCVWHDKEGKPQKEVYSYLLLEKKKTLKINDGDRKILDRNKRRV